MSWSLSLVAQARHDVPRKPQRETQMTQPAQGRLPRQTQGSLAGWQA